MQGHQQQRYATGRQGGTLDSVQEGVLADGFEEITGSNKVPSTKYYNEPLDIALTRKNLLFFFFGGGGGGAGS